MGSESSRETVERLMAEGLDHYGQDRVARAVECWQQVLRLEPGHAEALDYLRSAGFEPEAPATAAPAAREDVLVREALELCRAGEPESALELMESVGSQGAGALRFQATLELIRSRLFVRYRDRLGGGSCVPRVRLRPEEVLRYNLPADAGFVLSMVDGQTAVDDLVAVAGMDPFAVLHALNRLVGAGIVEATP